MKFKKLLTVLLILPFVFVSAQINEKNLMKTVSYLAGKELAGRLPGHTGYTKAAQFMAKNFKQLKLKPVGKDYYQKLKVEYNEINGPEHFAIIKNGNKKEYKLGPDYAYRGLTGAGRLNSEVVFCGYGLSQPELGYDDYAGMDVKNKVVLVFKYNPKWNIDGKGFTNGNPREKAIIAAKHGAVGILFVSLPNDKEPQKPIGSQIAGAGEQMINFPEVHIELYMADELFEGSGRTLKELQTAIDANKKPVSIPLTNKIDMEVHTKYYKAKEVVNIAGILEGSDPVLKNEYIILGAHLDHVGAQAGKLYFPGANDNASGSAAVLQIAREFVEKKIKPKRSIMFVLFANEESGLNGSTFMANNLPFPKEKAKLMMNMDCIACGDSIQVNGGKNVPELWKFAKEYDAKNDKLMTAATGGSGGADAAPFFQNGIQTLYFVTTNSYKYLHMYTDTPETLNQKLFAGVAKVAFNILKEAANK